MSTNNAEPHSSTLSDRIICDLSDKLSSTLTRITSRIAIDDGTFVLQELASFEADILASIQRTAHAQELLLHTRDKVREFIRSVQTVVGPVQKLPLELVGEILQNYLSPDQPMMLPPSHRCKPKLVIFGQVCRQWRAAAFMTPISWSSIHISIPQILDLAKAEKLKNLLSILYYYDRMFT